MSQAQLSRPTSSTWLSENEKWEEARQEEVCLSRNALKEILDNGPLFVVGRLVATICTKHYVALLSTRLMTLLLDRELLMSCSTALTAKMHSTC